MFPASLRPGLLVPCVLALALAQPALAVVIAPGATVPLAGFNFPGLVIQDVLRPVVLTDGTVITLQDRVVKTASGALSFDRVIRNTSNTPISVKDLVETGFSGWNTDVDFDPTSAGIVAEPHTAVRDAAGNSITFTNMVLANIIPDASASPVNASYSRFYTDLTNATNYALIGTTTIDAFAVTVAPISGTVATFAPSVPEPASLSLLAAGSLLLLRKRR